MGGAFYLARAGNRAGPFTWQELRDLAARGQMQPTDQIWAIGEDGWKAAADISGLLASQLARESAEPELEVGAQEPPGSATHTDPAIDAMAAQNARKSARPNIVIRHWRGDCSLAISYWLLNFLGTLVLLIIGAALDALPNDELDPRRSGALILLFWLCAFLVTIWQVWAHGDRPASIQGEAAQYSGRARPR